MRLTSRTPVRGGRQGGTGTLQVEDEAGQVEGQEEAEVEEEVVEVVGLPRTRPRGWLRARRDACGRVELTTASRTSTAVSIN